MGQAGEWQGVVGTIGVSGSMEKGSTPRPGEDADDTSDDQRIGSAG